MNRLIITITPKDIEKGLRLESPSNPLINASKRAVDYRSNVRLEQIGPDLRLAVGGLQYGLPKDAILFLSDWQACRGLKPLVFIAERV